MQLFAGMDESANVLLDARSKRAYVAHLEKGVVVGETQILEVDQLEDFCLNEHPGEHYMEMVIWLIKKLQVVISEEFYGGTKSYN